MSNAKSKSKKRNKIIILVVILLALGGLGAFAYLHKREVVITVQTEKVSRRNMTELVTANGRIQPVLLVKISPEVSGELIALPVKEGQLVRKGDLLLKIKPDLYVAARNSSEANYKGSLAAKRTAEASLRKAESEFQRYEQLLKDKLVSDSNYLDVKTSYEIAKAQQESSVHQVEMAAAALSRAEEDLSKTTIVSPLDGTVTRLVSQLGERVVGTAMMAGTEVMSIADLNEMEARVDIGEIDVVLIGIGQVARLEVDAYKDRKFKGVVTEIANSSKGMASGGGGQSQEATKFEVKIRVQEKETFRPGMSVTAEIETRSKTNVLAVPIASVTTRIPKETGGDKKKGAAGAAKAGATNSASAKTNSPGAQAAVPSASTNASTNVAAASSTNTSASTNTAGASGSKKPGDAPKPIEVVFLKEGDAAKMVPVKRGISDDAYSEITEGVKEGQEVISGGYKAVSRELEEGKKIKIGSPKSEGDKQKKDEK